MRYKTNLKFAFLRKTSEFSQDLNQVVGKILGKFLFTITIMLK